MSRMLPSGSGMSMPTIRLADSGLRPPERPGAWCARLRTTSTRRRTRHPTRFLEGVCHAVRGTAPRCDERGPGISVEPPFIIDPTGSTCPWPSAGRDIPVNMGFAHRRDRGSPQRQPHIAFSMMQHTCSVGHCGEIALSHSRTSAAKLSCLEGRHQLIASSGEVGPDLLTLEVSLESVRLCNTKVQNPYRA